LTCSVSYEIRINKLSTIDIINEFEDNDILFVDKEIYGVNDIIEIKDIKLGARSMFNTKTWYIFKIKVDGKEITDADWFGTDEFPEIPRQGSIARSLIDAFCDGMR
jgi:hypothetical protein